jgi:hypothetical protein
MTNPLTDAQNILQDLLYSFTGYKSKLNNEQEDEEDARTDLLQ